MAGMSSKRTFTALFMMLNLLRSTTIAATATSLAKVRSLNSTSPKQIGFVEDILDFGLPYGCLGFISDAYAFYAAFMLFHGYSPLFFVRDQPDDATRLKWWHLNTALAIAQPLKYELLLQEHESNVHRMGKAGYEKVMCLDIGRSPGAYEENAVNNAPCPYFYCNHYMAVYGRLLEPMGYNES
ncbi:hypothetical protein NHQ30_008253 [Ciborinia camelliae]|nr:hypothetical protein NHQ30_008253 [Ciborinia camelliae]